MSFLSVNFFIFFIILLLVLNILKGEREKRLMLLFSSYVFYAFFNIWFVPVLFLLSLYTYALGKGISKARAQKNSAAGMAVTAYPGKPSGMEGKIRGKTLLIIGAASEIAVLAFFKYINAFTDFFCRSLGGAANVSGESCYFHVLMPVGLSFYLLQAISYLVDIYRGDLEEVKSLPEVLLYVGFFPQLVSGPIIKAKEFFPMLKERKGLTGERLSYGVQLFITGILLKLVFADRLAVSVNSVYSAPLAYSGLSLFTASLAYTLQIYFDFAGYSNMAIGVAHILGFDYGRNFNLPYLAKNPSDFWRRWHISLSTFLRDYVYIPLGGSRRGRARTYLNLLLTMLISGLWHGSTLNFLLWGALHGVGSIVNSVCRRDRNRSRAYSRSVNGASRQGADSGYSDMNGVSDSMDDIRETAKHSLSSASGAARHGLLPAALIGALKVVVNFLFVSFLWIPFRAETLSDTLVILGRIFTMSQGITYIYVFTPIFLIILIMVQLYAVRFTNGDSPYKPFPLGRFWGKYLISMEVLAILMFAYFGNSAFIYSQF